MTRKQTTDQEVKDQTSAPADPGIVPVEQGNATDRLATRSTATAAEIFGPNNEQLPERLQNAVRRLVLELASESEISRRAEIRRIKQAHQFWRGLQYLWWSERDQNWHLPFEQKATEESFARGHAALRVRHEYLSGVWPVDYFCFEPGHSARAILSAVGGKRGGCFVGEIGERSVETD